MATPKHALLTVLRRAAGRPRVVAAGSLPYPCRLIFPRQLSSSPRRTSSWADRQDLPFDPKPALDSKGKVPAMPYDSASLPGTAPEYRAHIIVHPYSRPRPAGSWPSHLDSVSPFLSELSSRCKEGANLAGYGVNFSDGELSEGSLQLPDWDSKASKFMRPLPGNEAEEEHFLLYVYLPPGKTATVGPISLKTLDEGKPFHEKILDALEQAKPQTARRKPTDETHIYVCTHGTRDCRCGVAGIEVFDALRRTFAQENAQGKLKPTKIFGVSHVGGHKWAANALVYPHGDWYGNLRDWDASLLLRAAQAPASSIHDLQDDREKMVHWSRWRGRLGMPADKMMQHYEHWGPPLTQAAVITPAKRAGGAAPTSASSAQSPSSATSSSVELPLRFRSYEGEWFDVTGKEGETLKDVAKRHSLPSIEATCGGEVECATCHAYFAPPSEQADAQGKLDAAPPTDIIGTLTDEEDDMLDYAITRHPTSRLTCQVKVTKALSDWMQQGGRIELPRF